MVSRAMVRLDRRGLARFVLVSVPSLVLATLVVALLQSRFGVTNASSVYLTAVVAAAIVSGARGAAAVALLSFLLYDFFFIEPRFTLTIHDPAEWLNAVLLLFVGIVVGELAALQRKRTETARAREREALALFQLSHALATRPSTPAVLPEIAEILVREIGADRVWVALGSDDQSERVAADSGGEESRPPTSGAVNVLRRTPGEAPASWVRVRDAGVARGRPTPSFELYRVRIQARNRVFGSVWAVRLRDLPEIDRTGTRLLSAAADQVGQALAQDSLAAENQAAEIARQSDALKSALLQSVSHDLRTPLATIRAAAGTLRPDSGLSTEDRRESADAIDREVEYLNRLVTNLLDLSRIEAGALRADTDAFELDDLVGPTVERIRPRFGTRPLEMRLDVPPVRVDPIFLDEAVVNVLENALKYTPEGSAILIDATVEQDGRVRLTIEDAGPGVPPDALPRLFDKFYRVPGRSAGSRSGTGIGLAVARGLVEAMGGRISARRGLLGGLAVDIFLPTADVHRLAVAPPLAEASAVPAPTSR
jgi:two-component system, OmpR family, sensor histidine kinase KdpD